MCWATPNPSPTCRRAARPPLPRAGTCCCVPSSPPSPPRTTCCCCCTPSPSTANPTSRSRCRCGPPAVAGVQAAWELSVGRPPAGHARGCTVCLWHGMHAAGSQAMLAWPHPPHARRPPSTPACAGLGAQAAGGGAGGGHAAPALCLRAERPHRPVALPPPLQGCRLLRAAHAVRSAGPAQAGVCGEGRAGRHGRGMHTVLRLRLFTSRPAAERPGLAITFASTSAL